MSRPSVSAGLGAPDRDPDPAGPPRNAYWRQRADHVRAVGTCIQRIQKVLTQMNIQLANVISDLSAWKGQRIVRAILGGERDRQALAAAVST